MLLSLDQRKLEQKLKNKDNWNLNPFKKKVKILYKILAQLDFQTEFQKVWW